MMFVPLDELTAKTETGNQLAISILIPSLEVVEQLASLVNHSEKTLTGMVIFLVLTEMTGEFYNSLR